MSYVRGKLYGTPFSVEAARAVIGDIRDGRYSDIQLAAYVAASADCLLDTNEVIYLVAGRMTVTPDGGQSKEIGVGDIAVFPLGWSGTWEIHETVRKVYSIF